MLLEVSRASKPTSCDGSKESNRVIHLADKEARRREQYAKERSVDLAVRQDRSARVKQEKNESVERK